MGVGVPLVLLFGTRCATDPDGSGARRAAGGGAVARGAGAVAVGRMAGWSGMEGFARMWEVAADSPDYAGLVAKLIFGGVYQMRRPVL